MISEAIQKIREKQEEFVTHEIDAVIDVHSAAMHEKWIEIKLFTCPDQFSRVLEKYLVASGIKGIFYQE